MKKEWQHYFNNIKVGLGLYDWKLKYDVVDTEGMCHRESKTIAIGRKVKNWKYLILHEFAHSLTNRFCNKPHNSVFYKTLEGLARKFLSQGLCDSDNRAKDIYMKDNFEGYYRVVYDGGQYERD